jgi:hypothetical protein
MWLHTLTIEWIALEAFLDIEGTFDLTSFEATASPVRRHGVKLTQCRWMNSMLENRTIKASLLGDILIIYILRQYLSPLLWIIFLF